MLLQLWNKITDAPPKHLKIAISDSFAEQLVSQSPYSYHQAEIVLVRGMGNAKQVGTDSVSQVSKAEFTRESMQPVLPQSLFSTPYASEYLAR